jgi:TatD DNase family protein
MGYYCFMPRPLLIDTHAHVNFRDFKEDGDEVIRRALKSGVWTINVGAQYSTSRRAVEYAEKYKEGVYAIVGLHPIHVFEGAKEKGQGGKIEEREFEELDEKKYMELLENPKTVALGEIGLDYTDQTTEEQKEKQKEALVRQLELAQQMDKPVVFHCRKAHDDLIDILMMFQMGCASCPMACSPGLKGVIHCFMGRLSQAQKLMEMGFLFGFNGLITYARDYDKVIQALPLERIVLETDCPYLTPEPHRDKRNEPLYVKYVAEKIAEIKRIKFEEVTEQTTKNARELFGI